MQPPSPQKPRRRQEEGIALVVVLLFTVIVLTMVVSTTATLAIGARGGGVNERTAYQALLAAESVQNTFSARVRALPPIQRFQGNTSAINATEASTVKTALNKWLIDKSLSSMTVGESGTVQLAFDVTPSPAGGSVSLIASSTTAAAAAKVVLQDYRAFYAPAFNIRADAPLVSYPNVNVKGGAQVSGERLTSSANTGMVAVASANELNVLTVNTTVGQPTFDLNLTPTLSNRLLLDAGDYIDISDTKYEVTAVQGTRVTLRPMTQPTVSTILRNATVNRLDSAVTADFTQQSGTETPVAVSDPTFFVKGSKVQIGSMVGAVTSIDTVAKTIKVLWDASPSGTASILKGTPIRRDVMSVASGYGVTGDTQAIPDGSTANDLRLRDMNPFDPNASPDLFTNTFGQTKDQMLNVTPYHGWLTPLATSFTGAVNGLTFVNSSVSLSGSQELCGTGILIVRGNLTVNGTCPAGFRGAIYVMGDYDQQGNSVITGAVIAEGATEIVNGTECVVDPTKDGTGTGNSCDTQVSGTGQGNGKIVYDRGALLAAGSLLTPPTFTAIQGTWRQR